MGNRLYLVVPCYNEQEVLDDTAKKLKDKMDELIKNKKIADDSRIMFVDDGSKDKTWGMIEKHCNESELFSGVKLSRNKGHQNAVLAGLTEAREKCDMTISLDADLQDDINAIDKMVDEFAGGSDVVYGVRNSRKKDSFFKRTTAQGFYKVMKLLGVDILYNHADYRLMSSRAIDGLLEFKEVNLFLRGIVPLIGYRYSVVEYERGERLAGESKYPLKKMLAFAFDGITSFSIKPIRMITAVGIIVLIASAVALIYSLVQNILGATISGWTSLMCSIWFLGGVQLFSIGIIGEYIGKVYFEAKARPKFIVETKIDR